MDISISYAKRNTNLCILKNHYSLDDLKNRSYEHEDCFNVSKKINKSYLESDDQPWQKLVSETSRIANKTAFNYKEVIKACTFANNTPLKVRSKLPSVLENYRDHFDTVLKSQNLLRADNRLFFVYIKRI